MLKIYISTAIFLACLSWGLFTSFEILRFTKDQHNINGKFLNYTIVSVILTSLVSMYVWVVSLEFPEYSLFSSLFKSQMSCLSYISFILIFFSFLWSFYGIGIVFIYGGHFPSFSTLGCFTLSYLLLFSFLPLLILITTIKWLGKSLSTSEKVHPQNSVFIVSLVILGFPLTLLTFFCTTLPEAEANKFLTLLAGLNTLNIVLSIFFSGLEQKWIREFGFNSYCRLACMEIMHLFITICNPLLPLFSLMDFITKLAKTNIYAQYPLYGGCLTTLLFLQVSFGLVWPVWHNIVIIQRFKTSSTRIIDQLKFQSVNYSVEEMIQFCLVLALCINNLPQNQQYNPSLNDQLILSILGIYMLFSIYFSAFCFCDNCSTGCTRKLMYVMTFCFYFQYFTYSIAFIIQLPSNYSFSFLINEDSRLFGISLILFTCLMICHLLVDAPRVLYNTIYLIPKYIDEVTGFPRDEEELDALLVQQSDLIFQQVLQYSSPTRDHPEADRLTNQVCAICINAFLPDDDDDNQESVLQLRNIARIKNCGHYFHQDCIKNWLMHRTVCPIDRRFVAPRPEN